MKMSQEAYNAVKELLKADPADRGFIVFSGKHEMEYVQFMIEENGLLMNWPILKKVPKRSAKVAELACRELIRKDYNRRNVSEIDRTAVLALKEKEFMLDSEDLYANPGKEAEEIVALAAHLFINVFDYQKLDKIEIELVLEQ